MTNDELSVFIPVLFGVAAVFGYHTVIGWRTEIVRFPLSILVVEEFERERSAANYWGIMAVDSIAAIAAFGGALFLLTTHWLH